MIFKYLVCTRHRSKLSLDTHPMTMLLSFYCLFVCLLLEIGFYCITQANLSLNISAQVGLGLMAIIVSQLPRSWDYNHVPGFIAMFTEGSKAG